MQTTEKLLWEDGVYVKIVPELSELCRNSMVKLVELPEVFGNISIKFKVLVNRSNFSFRSKPEKSFFKLIDFCRAISVSLALSVDGMLSRKTSRYIPSNGPPPKFDNTKSGFASKKRPSTYCQWVQKSKEKIKRKDESFHF